MPAADLRSTILAAWRTNCLVTAGLIEGLPARLWDAAMPGIAEAHGPHDGGPSAERPKPVDPDAGTDFGITAPPLVDLRRVTRRGLLAALKRSGRGIEALLELGLASGGEIPAAKAYVRRNLPLDVGH